MFRATLVIALVCSSSFVAPAEASAKRPQKIARCSVHQPGGETRLRAVTDVRTGACTGFEILDRKGRAIIVHHDAFYGNGRLVSSLDGRRVLFVNDFPQGTLKRDGTIAPLNRPKDVIEKRGARIEALVFFFDGRKVASHYLEDLLVRPFLVDTTPTQVQWLTGDVSFLSQALSKTVTVTTTSFRHYRFDSETGKAVSANDSNHWHQCSAIVYGNISTFKDGSCGANPFWLIKGMVPKPLHFDLADDLNFSNGLQTACLMRPKAPGDGRDKLLATRLFGPLNGVTLRP